jgi:hypothetical protein
MPIRASVVELQALASEIRLKADTAAAKLDAATQADLLQAITSYVELQAQTYAPVLDASVVAVLLKVDTIVGEFVRFISLTDIAAISDAQLKAVSKAFIELLGAVDVFSKELNKGVSESLATLDSIVQAVDKQLTEALATAEQVSKGFTAAPKSDLVYVTEDAVWAASKGFSDTFGQSEGPFISQNYVDPTYLAEDYVLDGNPIKLFTKVVTDALGVTDDFLGVANVDDDQIIVFSKSLLDMPVTSDVADKSFSRTGVTSAAAATDSAAVTAGKTLADVLSNLEILVRDVGKNLSDSTSFTDSATKSTAKALSDTALFSELLTFSTAKSLQDAALLSDLAAKNLSRNTSDSVTIAEVSSREPGKGLSDSAATSESGLLRKTDYADITYFAEDYVGSTLTF